MSGLKTVFTGLIAKYSETTGEELWQEIEQEYSSASRHYHNLNHLENLFNELSAVKERIQNWDSVLFALFYHDIIYNVLKSDNEEQSALLARKRLTAVKAPGEIIERCIRHILATQSHTNSDDTDTDYFTDADLAILGSDQSRYDLYAQQVRMEYRIYPDLVYKPGRKKVLKHFLSMNRIYKTEYFTAKYEQQARQNLLRELNSYL